MTAEPEHTTPWNSSDATSTRLEENILNSFMCVVCIFGLMGNGTVIWLLGFRLKRNPFTTYILNLAVADLGILISLNLIAMGELFSNFDIFFPWRNVSPVEYILFEFAHSTSHFLLTAISVDKCVAVLFPFWYRCHRPLHLSSTVCATLWVLCVLLYGLNCILPQKEEHALPLFYMFLVISVVCLPLITISTLILFFMVCLKTQQRQWGKILTTILLTLSCFLILAFPTNAIYLVTYHDARFTHYDLVIRRYHLYDYCLLCASLNSFVNPLIYFLVGKEKRGLCRENLKLVLQRIFKEEEFSRENQQYPLQTQF